MLWWVSIAASVIWPPVITDNVIANKSSRMNSGMYTAILSAQIEPNAAKMIGKYFTVQMNNE